MSGWEGMVEEEGDGDWRGGGEEEEEGPQERMEGCTGERRVGFRETFLCIKGSIGARSVRWMVRSGECRARASLRKVR